MLLAMVITIVISVAGDGMHSFVVGFIIVTTDASVLTDVVVIVSIDAIATNVVTAANIAAAK